MSDNRNAQIAGLGIAAAGLISKLVSAATTPAADTRAWDNLPQFLSFAAVPLPTGPHTAVVEYLDPAGQPIPRLTKTVNINVTSAKSDKVVFVSDTSIPTLNL